jgi:5-methylthioadenosine/S-adenosylhomocysteine deaminase
VTGPVDRPQAGAAPISSLLSPIQLDPLTVADDPGWLAAVGHEMNLPEYVAHGLGALYEP